MGKKGIRDYLRDHSKAIRDIELTEAAILILDSVTGMQSVLGTLKRKQQVISCSLSIHINRSALCFRPPCCISRNIRQG